MKLDLRRFGELGLPTMGVMAPVLLLASIGASIWAAGSVQEAAATMANRQALSTSDAVVSIKHESATPDQVRASAQRLSELAPAVNISVRGSDLILSTASVDKYSDWLNALTMVQSTLPGFQWSAESICIASCTGSAVIATLRASRPSFAIRKPD